MPEPEPEHTEPEDMGADEHVDGDLLELFEVLKWERALGERGVLDA